MEQAKEQLKEKTLPLMLRSRVREAPEIVVQYSKDPAGWFITKTYHQLYDEGRWVAAGLLELGAKRGDLVGLISDNRQEWLAADFGIQAIGAADVPRGSDTLNQELSYILSFTGCGISFAENQKLAVKLLSCKADLPELKIIVTFETVGAEIKAEAESLGITIYSYRELLNLGKNRREIYPGEVDAEIAKGKGDDTVTVIFTSGTTGEPKGVMLTHKTFLCQVPRFHLVFDTKPGEIWLSVLPVWHVFERAIEYVALYHKNAIAYSKPISSVLMADFANIKPHWMVAVPRVWEAVMDGIYRSVKLMGKFQEFFFNFFVSFGLMYAYFRDLAFGLIPNFHGRVRAVDAVLGFFPWLLLAPVRGLAYLIVFRRLKLRLGGRFRAGISGGGALPARVDHFFNAVGLRLQEGYGLTETSPIVSVRQYRKSRRGTIGQILVDDTEFRILDDKGRELPPGSSGILYVRGPQVMKGYYKKPELTAEVLSADGWLNTGDIAMHTRDGELRLTGRAKDTIVLRGGENVEPVPIENKLKESPRIGQCVVLGQDQKYLAALIVPVQDAVMAFAEENNIPIVDYELLLQQPEIVEIISTDVADLVNARNGFKAFERIYKFKLLPRAFDQGTEISSKQEPLRHRIMINYAKDIQTLFK
ncbi:AMP-dependent synthetase/ligase [Leadbettera azotonutricia]|uniref:Long-chain-fatty-acid--CoA ligase n=1 Tax=Leadbettera azotonutricia (strain ATCC BAA-888 / DSM 13862 / ZAS-9) TaxID=545695 RepID=F5YBA6_LEAAZ|nr:long-chain fatty acid--CoA ligase [Leadbettera azotonutricia]AEF83090.1 long-chain-fatty-acid--CoA ligase [Leadbettera azotonutricia ZAS-9]